MKLFQTYMLVALIAAVGFPADSQAVDINPVYSLTFEDAVTGDNSFFAGDGKRYWTVDPGADIYQKDCYERPTIQTYSTQDGKFASQEYFGYIDLTAAKTGFDDKYFYVSLDLFSRDNGTSDGKDTEKGLLERYGFRLSTDPDGRNGLLLVSDQPEAKNGTTFGLLSNFGYQDSDGDVGGAATGAPGKGTAGPTGLEVTKSDNPEEEVGLNGFDSVVISDGKNSAGQEVLFSRVDPTDDTIVEFAFDYKALGLTMEEIGNLGYLTFEAIKGDPKDPQNYLWNDKYTQSEAGSPNPGSIHGMSEFGTQGLGNIYELDTICVGDNHEEPPPPPVEIIPEPASMGLLALGLASLALRRRKND